MQLQCGGQNPDGPVLLYMNTNRSDLPKVSTSAARQVYLLILKCSESDSVHKSQNPPSIHHSSSVLVLAGIELILYLVVSTVLCFGFGMRVASITHGSFKFLLSSVYPKPRTR